MQIANNTYDEGLLINEILPIIKDKRENLFDRKKISSILAEKSSYSFNELKEYLLKVIKNEEVEDEILLAISVILDPSGEYLTKRLENELEELVLYKDYEAAQDEWEAFHADQELIDSYLSDPIWELASYSSSIIAEGILRDVKGILDGDYIEYPNSLPFYDQLNAALNYSEDYSDLCHLAKTYDLIIKNEDEYFHDILPSSSFVLSTMIGIVKKNEGYT